MVRRWPVLSPLAQRTRILEGPWTLFKQPQIVQWVKEILVTSITACMASQQTSLEENLDLKGIGFQCQFLPRWFNRDRGAVGIRCHLALPFPLRLARAAA